MTTNKQPSGMTFKERLAASIDKPATTTTYDTKGGQKAFEANCGQSSRDPWRINHYR